MSDTETDDHGPTDDGIVKIEADDGLTVNVVGRRDLDNEPYIWIGEDDGMIDTISEEQMVVMRAAITAALEPRFTVETYRTTAERPDGDTVTEYRWRARARNHEVLCSGEGYTRVEARDDAVALLWPGVTPVEVTG